MPSEPLPWDRKEVFFKERKQERGAGCDVVGGGSGVGGVSCSTSRWREPYHGVRDFPRASPLRSFTGHYRHDGGYHQLYPEESTGHGCTPSRSADRFWPEDEIFRPSSGRCGGSGGGRDSSTGGRESRGSSRRSPCLDSGGDYIRENHVPPVTSQRSVAVSITHASSSSSSPPHLKNLPEKNDVGVIDGVGTSQRYERDHSLGSIAWKPLKWTRPSSLPLPKAVRSEPEEANHDISLPQAKESPARSPVTSHLPLDDRTPCKKPRLGWGQGLAKYEKQKVGGSVDFCGCNGSVQSTNSGKEFISASSPKISVLPGSMSPATPTSATCSSSPACTYEKLPIKSLTAETDRTQCSDSSGLGPHYSPDDVYINLNELDANSMSTLALLLTDLMQPEDACSGDSSFDKNSTINKLLLLKKNISKELEKTECEIDLFENTSKKNGLVQPSAMSVEDSKSLSELSSPDNCALASSVIVHTPSSKEHSTEVKDTYNNSSEDISRVEFELAYLERDNHKSCNLQSDICHVSSKDENPQFQDAEHVMHPVVPLPDDICSLDLSYCLDYGTEKADERLVAFILASNRDATQRASQEFDQAMPPEFPQFNISELISLQCRKNYTHIRVKLAVNKRKLKFKERVLALKFRALHHLWIEDLNLLNMRKHRPKSSKRTEVNSRSSNTALQKHRSSIRSRFALPAGNLTLVPTTEILNFTSKLLLASEMRLYRNSLKMPAQIIDENEKRYSRFNSNNGLIEDPPGLEISRVMMNPWMQEEREVFLEMLATFGKDFKKISSFLSHRTTADCIEFYYKKHKLESFAEVKRKLKWRKQYQSRHSNTYLITSGNRFNREANAASLGLLGATSMISAEGNCNRRNSQKQSVKSCYISESEREAAAADVLAGICCALSSDAMSSCVTSSIDPPEKMRIAARIDRSLTPEAIDEEDTCSDESCDELVESGDWTDDEKSMFIRALNMYGKDFVKVAHFVRTRSREQCKVFFSKARKCLGLDVIQPGSTDGVTPLSDVNGGRSDTDDAFAAEIDSAICSTQSCSKIDTDSTQSMLKTCSDEHTHPSNIAQQADTDEVDGKFDDSKAEFVIEEKGGGSGLKSNDGDRNNESTTAEAAAQKKTTSNVLNNNDVDSIQLVEINREEVKMKESAKAGDSYFFSPNSHSNVNPYDDDDDDDDDGEERNDECPPNLVVSSSFQQQVPLELLCSLQKIHQQTKVAKPEPAVSSRLTSSFPDSSVSLNEEDDEPSIAILKLQDRGGSVGGRAVLPQIDFGYSQVPGPNNDKRVSAEDQSQQRVGDLKLFGQILTHPSSSSSSSQKQPQQQEGNRMSLSPRRHNAANTSTSSPTNCWKDAAIFAHRPGRNSLLHHQGGELQPQRSYGFWDGNRIQTGFSSLPESAIILAKYQASGLSGMPLCMVKESGGSSSNADYQQQARMHLDAFSELQKRNGFDLLSGFQEQGRKVQQQHQQQQLGGGVGVSDPVAALEMHYSGRRGKILTADLEGDTGKR